MFSLFCEIGPKTAVLDLLTDKVKIIFFKKNCRTIYIPLNVPQKQGSLIETGQNLIFFQKNFIFSVFYIIREKQK